MNKRDISTEKWRQYEWIVPETGELRKVRIPNPLVLSYEKGGSCHVITAKDEVEGIISMCVPSVGRYGCILTWQGKEDPGDVTFVSASKENEK